MSAAGFVLAINVFVAGLFTAAFAVVAWRTRTVIGARWLSLACGLGIINALLEFALPAQADPRWMSLAVFTLPLVGFGACIVGLARHYGVTPPWRVLAGLVVVSVLANIAIESQSSRSFVHAAIYQAPYFFAHLLAAAVLLRSRRRLDALDLTLLVFLLFSSLQYVAKPLLVAGLGSVNAQDYLQSAYGAYSQTLIAFLLITNGVLMLLVFVRDALAELTRRSQTDTLSGLLNRGGFDDLADKMLASALRDGAPATMVVADLDHFKAINDNHGHEAGDRVIAAFGQVLSVIAEPRAIIGRLGGEEFATFIPANLATAQLYAEGVRSGFSSLSIAQLGLDRTVSASFGIAQLKPGDGLSDLLRRADAALYEAKKGGRNRVWIAEPEPAAPPAADPVLKRQRGAGRVQRA